MDNQDSVKWFMKELRTFRGFKNSVRKIGMVYGKAGKLPVSLALTKKLHLGLARSLDVEILKTRNLKCRFYDNCLTFTALESAENFSCEKCDIWANCKN